MDSDYQRRRSIRGLAEFLRRRSFPRLALGLVLALTALTGFGISFLLLKAGMGDMWMRYPVAVLGAYGVFLLLMRAWVEIEQMQINPEDPELLEALEKGAPEPAKSSRGWDWLDGLDLANLDLFDAEGCLPMILIGVVAGLIVLVIVALIGAPVLLAEVLIDILLAGILYRRLKRAAEEHWLGTCIRKTWAFVLCTAGLLFLAGLCLTFAAPGAESIGPAVERILHPEETPKTQDVNGSFREAWERHLWRGNR
jgi:hypothetical protein